MSLHFGSFQQLINRFGPEQTEKEQERLNKNTTGSTFFGFCSRQNEANHRCEGLPLVPRTVFVVCFHVSAEVSLKRAAVSHRSVPVTDPLTASSRMSLIDATSHQFHPGSASAREKKNTNNKKGCVSVGAAYIAEFLCGRTPEEAHGASKDRKFATEARVD